MDQNRLCEVTEAIGDCENLSELILTENLLTVGRSLGVPRPGRAWFQSQRGRQRGWGHLEACIARVRVPVCVGS